jgi:hypothetical protein
MKISKLKKLYSKKDKAHNWNHILRLKKRIKVLKKPYKNINENLLNFLVNHHGLKDYVKENKNQFDRSFVQALLRHHKNPKTSEEKIVFDANMLDNVGYSGIKKALNVGEDIGRSKKETFEYLKKNIQKVKFYTKRGKEMGKKEILIMKKRLKEYG